MIQKGISPYWLTWYFC